MNTMVSPPTYRRLAAILAADVVGYSKLMGVDELATLAALKRHRGEVFDPAVARFNGRIFKLMGDGTLVEFASVVDAVNCAVDIQMAVAAAAPEPGQTHIMLRIGVNLGDVIIDDDDVYGDGVNIAARLEPLAHHGGICISSIVKESVGDRIDVTFGDAGEVEVKNIARPLRIWKWKPGEGGKAPAHESALAASSNGATAESAKPAPAASIAVLPFDNMSGDPEQEYFSDGISEDIITDLSKISGLVVIARNSSFAYKGTSIDLRKVGRELGVNNVLEGSIRRAGNRVRITAQLIDATNGAHLWAERFDRDLTDIFAVQDEVTLQIVGALKVALTPSEEARVAVVAHDPAAHDAYMRGREILARTLADRSDLEAVQRLLKKAIEIEPRYSEAHAALAMSYNYDYMNHWTDQSDKIIELGIETARRAVEFDPNEPFAHYALAVTTGVSGDAEASRKSVAEVLRLNPNFASGYILRGLEEIAAGRKAAAISHIEKAIRLDPANNIAIHFLGMAHLFAGNFETAAATFRHRLIVFPKTDISRALLAAALGHLGDLEEARRIWGELLSIKPDYSLDTHMRVVFFRDPVDENTVRQGLAKAGLPG
jgi:adenylate cyclase